MCSPTGRVCTTTSGEPEAARSRVAGLPGDAGRLGLGLKVTADQRGRGVGVSIDEYAKTSVKDKAVAAKKLEQAAPGKGKIVRMPPQKAS